LANLASSQARESDPRIKKFNIVLFDVYANSAVHNAGLEAIQTFIQENKVNYWNLAQ